MKRNRDRIAKPRRAADLKSNERREEPQRDVRARGSRDDEAAEASHQKGEPGEAAPLAGRDPDAVAQQQEDDEREIGGVEQVLAVMAHHELAGDRDDRRSGGEPPVAGPKQQRERKRRDQGAERIESREAAQPGADPLGGKRAGTSNAVRPAVMSNSSANPP